MLKKSLLHILLLLLFSSSVVLAQSGDEEDDDPFRNDPFFSKPFKELLKRPDTNTASDSAWDEDDEDVYHYLGRMNEEGLDFGGALEAGPYSSPALYSQYPSLPMIHFNRVDGLFLGIRKERMQWYEKDWIFDIPNIRPHGMLGYSFGLDEWQYTIGVEKYIGRRQHIIIGGEYYSATSTNDYWRVGLTETTLTSFFAGYDYLDYYKQTGWGSYLLFRTRRLIEAGVAYSSSRFNSLSKSTDWALFGSDDRYRPNPPVEIINGTPVDTLDISALTFSAAFNPKRLVIAPYFTFSVRGEVELANEDFGTSDYTYNKYIGEIVTFFNFERGGLLKHRLRIGSITGQAPLFKSFQLGGVGSLRALPYKSLPENQLGGNQMILSNTEIQFGNPDWGTDEWIDFDDFYLTFFLDSGWANYDADLESDGVPSKLLTDFRFSDLKHTAGVGIGSSSIRFELAWDLNDTGRAPVFWIRFNPTF